MKKFFLITFIFTFSLGCKAQNHHHGKELITKTGKKIVVTETHSDSESMTSLTIQTNGLENDDSFVLKDIDPVKFMQLADLDQNGFEEIYIITQAVGSGSYQNIIGYASNNDKSFTPIYFPELTDTDFDKGGLFEGYMGHDSFFIQKDKLVRKFPIYLENDTNNNPTGGEKEISYLLKQGEASWQLQVQKTYNEKVLIVRDCSGTYIRMNEWDYKVCNDTTLVNIKNDAFAKISFIDINKCKLPEKVAVCMLYHEHVGAVKILEIH
ncbi:MAG: hypothetical protein COB73_08495 [Flavobacteriaceae bacterium]|nr:MAG: hypothetical protein COB73_08495 [Flavobacteriaceae bacterium]